MRILKNRSLLIEVVLLLFKYSDDRDILLMLSQNCRPRRKERLEVVTLFVLVEFDPTGETLSASRVDALELSLARLSVAGLVGLRSGPIPRNRSFWIRNFKLG